MKKSLIFAILLVSACQGSNGSPSAQGSGTPSPVSSPSVSETLPGGETTQDSASAQAEDIKIKAQNLLNQKYPGAGIFLTTIKRYTTQVVAGSNHRLEVEFTNSAGKTGLLHLTVFADLKGAYSLSEEDYSAVK
ncbi:hypothetical protein COW36_19930 [bacterium (Candidatus Blackallbacteria) CG17_big_fil_post_rev_8_21_14_2_50_48_46]|uniref:Cystatin domain-containing protein n=1 Tax=bacterium (Candidatus Blackallbacteria) CG17_big_fil_post_rev_8_21_14_2_50_48_46 TaxID=2014261 RepID=A0A2M7FZS7_9BACT|nr:MAG: hypothetical protein COW64_15365 [bacterium (Candidatus Blackallbacteria) CG18_big_fil_WC_8_21_14_2_50_49_26]PIW14918.1 MAG: hypothetical protein COW36_19930 [bacterium (Candidatus Blackallbacteria) CG17_big_fil_post_rev_8_21_14_2_50_48_46]PIW44294.1 MAG: hypothetical protein COW20_24430 [bacterium (Candidatus Blackallbacteria) CG13_big_fil_rev_8_21_14_2_50_49_14]